MLLALGIAWVAGGGTHAWRLARAAQAAPSAGKGLGGHYGFADKSGGRMILVASGGTIKSPERLVRALGEGGRSIPLTYGGRQKKSAGDTGRQTAHNFDNLEGEVYRVREGRAVPGKTYCLVEAGSSVLKRLMAPRKLASLRMSGQLKGKIERAKKRKVIRSAVLSELMDGKGRLHRLCAVQFATVKGQALASLVLASGDALAFKDFAARWNALSTWRVDDQGVFDTGAWECVYASGTGGDLRLAVTWAGPEGENVIELEASRGVLRETGRRYRYWAPL